MSSLQKNPTHVLIAINTIDVGVATFSLILNRMHKMENEQMSTPLPVHALKVPPMTPKNNQLVESIAQILIMLILTYTFSFRYPFIVIRTCKD